MRIPKLLLPILVVVALFAGFFLRTAFTKPTAVMKVGDGSGKHLEWIVDGVKCKGTSDFFISFFNGVDGINGITTYASEHKVVFAYDPDKITPEKIREIIEQDVLFNDGTRAQVFRVLSDN